MAEFAVLVVYVSGDDYAAMTVEDTVGEAALFRHVIGGGLPRLSAQSTDSKTRM